MKTNSFKILVLALLGVSLSISACKKKGCMDELASNYDPEAQKEDGSCKYNTGESQIVFFWPADSTCGLFHMNIDGDTIVSEFDQASFHGTTPFVGQDLDSGTHTYDVGDDCDTWTGSFTIDPDSTLEITLVR